MDMAITQPFQGLKQFHQFRKHQHYQWVGVSMHQRRDPSSVTGPEEFACLRPRSENGWPVPFCGHERMADPSAGQAIW
jgi:hypothetical protein